MSLQAETTKAPERRVALRRQPTLGTVCRLDGKAKGTAHLGLVWNLSATGISMLMHEPLQPGTELTGALTTTNEQATLPVALRVVHLSKLRTGDYILGAHFSRPLSTQDMRPFVASS